MEIIKRYQNRKLYHSKHGYITIKQVEAFLKEGAKVIDHKTGKDLTLFTYTALIQQQLKDNDSNLVSTLDTFKHLVLNS